MCFIMKSNLMKRVVNGIKSGVKKVINAIQKPFKAVVRFFINIDWAHVLVSTYVRYIIMILTIVNTILTKFDLNPISFSETEIYNITSDLITVIILIINTYKDNPTSKESITCTELQRAMKTSSDLEEIKAKLQEQLDELKASEVSKESQLEDTEETEE